MNIWEQLEEHRAKKEREKKEAEAAGTFCLVCGAISILSLFYFFQASMYLLRSNEDVKDEYILHIPDKISINLKIEEYIKEHFQDLYNKRLSIIKMYSDNAKDIERFNKLNSDILQTKKAKDYLIQKINLLTNENLQIEKSLVLINKEIESMYSMRNDNESIKNIALSVSTQFDMLIKDNKEQLEILKEIRK